MNRGPFILQLVFLYLYDYGEYWFSMTLVLWLTPVTPTNNVNPPTVTQGWANGGQSAYDTKTASNFINSTHISRTFEGGLQYSSTHLAVRQQNPEILISAPKRTRRPST